VALGQKSKAIEALRQSSATWRNAANQRYLRAEDWIVRAHFFLSLVAAFVGAGGVAQAADTKPNIVVILADDLGNADLGYRGSDIRTPNIDKLASDGVRLESFYGMPVCTPSRAELMTGRYAMRYGLQTLVIFPSHTYGLSTDERTSADLEGRGLPNGDGGQVASRPCR
jgi:hypothetical protein